MERKTGREKDKEQGVSYSSRSLSTCFDSDQSGRSRTRTLNPSGARLNR